MTFYEIESEHKKTHERHPTSGLIYVTEIYDTIDKLELKYPEYRFWYNKH